MFSPTLPGSTEEIWGNDTGGWNSFAQAGNPEGYQGLALQPNSDMVQLYSNMQQGSDSPVMLAPILSYLSSSPHNTSYTEHQSSNNQQQATYLQQGLDDIQPIYRLQPDSYLQHADTPQQADGAICVTVSQPLSAARVQQPAAGLQKNSSALSATTPRPERRHMSPASPSTQRKTMVSCTAGSDNFSSGGSHLRTALCQPVAEQQAVHNSLMGAYSHACSHDDAVPDPYADPSLSWGSTKHATRDAPGTVTPYASYLMI